MTERTPGKNELEQAFELELSDEDILDALSHVSGYLDISTEDFRIVYHLAWRHALALSVGRAQGLLGWSLGVHRTRHR